MVKQQLLISQKLGCLNQRLKYIFEELHANKIKRECEIFIAANRIRHPKKLAGNLDIGLIDKRYKCKLHVIQILKSIIEW